jgi:hypothetical protein
LPYGAERWQESADGGTQSARKVRAPPSSGDFQSQQIPPALSRWLFILVAMMSAVFNSDAACVFGAGVATGGP